MSTYNLQVNWSGKDALSDSDPDKVISGDDFNTEFTAVKTAVNTKAELNGDANESFSATTAASGTNTTQVATTQYVQSEDYATITYVTTQLASLGTNGNGDRTVSTSAPTGGSDGDVWYRY